MLDFEGKVVFPKNNVINWNSASLLFGCKCPHTICLISKLERKCDVEFTPEGDFYNR